MSGVYFSGDDRIQPPSLLALDRLPHAFLPEPDFDLHPVRLRNHFHIFLLLFVRLLIV